MTPAQIKAQLRSADGIRANAFGIARAICRLVCSDDEEIRQKGQDLLLRALENKEAFGSASELLDAVLREVGLFPYLNPDDLTFGDRIAYECHRPDNLDDRVFHTPQARVYRRLLGGKSVVLSAPTSFGKSLIVDAVIASGKFKNIVIVVPTIALIDETRRRLSRFRERYKIITHSFQAPGERNVYVMTQERVLDHPAFESVDFFVVDEFYKLSPTTSGDQERCALLNQAFYQLAKRCKHFYMLGPNIERVSEDFERRLEFEFIHEPFQTVASDVHQIKAGEDELVELARLCGRLEGPTIVFCKSPDRTASVARAIRDCGGEPGKPVLDAVAWIETNYHADWHFVDALKHGIGIHHARIPRALAQYVVRAFNAGELRFLVCTSTLIEGVNTKARNIVVLDHMINRQAIDLFTFNNIRGRSGRMFEHFVGHVYVFHEPPHGELPEVDVPAFTQTSAASDSLLLQLDDGDLSDRSRERLRRFESQNLLSLETLRSNNGVDPTKQIGLAEELLLDPRLAAQELNWRGIPKYVQLLHVCELIWKHFDGSQLAAQSVRTARQLAGLLGRLPKREAIRDTIQAQLKYTNNDADAAVRTVLDFLRLWATFHFPKLLRAVNRIASDVFSRRGLPVGDYSVYAALVESLFLEPSLLALEEYGVPLPLARKLPRTLSAEADFDKLLERFRTIAVGKLALSDFEREILLDAQNFA